MFFLHHSMQRKNQLNSKRNGFPPEIPEPNSDAFP